VTDTIHTTAEIERLIPHRHPFLLVDRIVEYDPEAKRIVGLKGVTATEWFFAGHFPGLPVMPGVLQVEALAQTMAVYVAKQPGFGDRIGLFAGIEDVRFKRIVAPGDLVAQFRQALANVGAVVEAQGGTLRDLVKVTFYVRDKNDYRAKVKPIGQIYRELLGGYYPATTLVEVKALWDDEALIEIDGIAVLE